MKKFILLLVLSLNIQSFGGRGVSGDGRIRVDPGLVENFVFGIPQYTVDGGNPIGGTEEGQTRFSVFKCTDNRFELSSIS